MHLRLLLIAAGAAACADTTSLAPAIECGPTATPAPPPPSPTESFQALAREAAARLGGEILGWGEIDLDDVAGIDRFAVIAGDSDGRYLIQTGEADLFTLSFRRNGRSPPWGTESGKRWTRLAERTFSHAEGWHGGGSTIELDIVQRQFVLVRIQKTQLSHRATHAEPWAFYENVDKAYPCAPSCTRYAPRDDEYWGVESPRGPVATLDALFPKKTATK
jgi:hypothetical protein